MSTLELSGVTTLNLKGFDLKLPYRSLTVITGRAGSGKSALLVHTLWALSRMQFVPSEKHAELRPVVRVLPQVRSANGMLAGVNLSAFADLLPQRQTIGELCALADPLSEVIRYNGNPSCGANDCRLVAGHWKVRAAELEKYLLEKPSRLMVGGYFGLKGMNRESAAEISRGFLKRGYRRYRIDKKIYRASGFDSKMPAPKREFSVLFDSFSGEEFNVSRLHEAFRHAEDLGTNMLEIVAVPTARSAEEIEAGDVPLALFYLTRGFLCAVCGKTYRQDGDAPRGAISNWWHGRSEAVWRESPLQEIYRALLAHDGGKEIERLRDKLAVFEALGLGNVRMDQRLATLSTGERLRVAAAFFELSDLTDTLFVCDEPSRTLHPRDLERLRRWTRRMIALGNTVTVAETSRQWISTGNYLVVLCDGEIRDRSYLPEQNAGGTVPNPPDSVLVSVKLDFEELGVCREYSVPKNALTAVVGLSGVGKTLLLRRLADRKKPWRKAELVERKRDKAETVAEATGAGRAVAQVFAKLAAAKREGLKEKDFLTGEPDSRVLGVTFHEMNISQIFALSVAEVLGEFSTQKEVVSLLRSLDSFGLSSVRFGAPLESLATSELARLRLAIVLRTELKSETIVLLDQPFAGMDVDAVELCFHQLRLHSKKKATFLFTTHDPNVISRSDYVLELGTKAELRFFGATGRFGLDQFLDIGEV